MRLLVTGTGSGGPGGRRRLARRLRLALGRFGPSIALARLRLVAPGAAAAGGCRLAVRLRTGASLVFEEIGAGREAAAARVADRAAKALDRLIRREPAGGWRAGD